MLTNLFDFFTPGFFKKFYGIFLPVLVAVTLTLCAISFFKITNSPDDYQQGDVVRIMYLHVPCAWLSLLVYTTMAVLNIVGFVWKNPFFYLSARSIAPIGAIFTTITLVSGSLWGKPTWGTWWVWDARLTSVLILLFLYLGYIILVNSYDDKRRGEKAGAIISIIGLINVPIIKFSVDFWNSLHQPASVIRKGGSAIDPSMLTPLLWMFATLLCCTIVVAMIKIQDNINVEKISRIELVGG